MKQQTRAKLTSLFRNLFLGSLALAIFVDQVFLVATAQPILIFLIIFLLGSIPALRGDGKSGRPSTFARVIMMLLGVQFPESYSENEEHPDGTRPSTDGPTPSPGPSHAGHSASSSKSHSASTKDRQ
jgi:hypothetical protein